MSGDKKPPIIKKIIKKGHGGHHGGSWKVAYADFVTALMAFFLVMWLLAISSEAGREALADYFTELTMHDAVFNGGMPAAFDPSSPKPSVLDGGCFSIKGPGDTKIDVDSDSEAAQAQMAALLKTTQELLQNLESLPEGTEGGEGSGDVGRGESDPAPLTAEEQSFAQGLHAEIQGSLGDAAAGQVAVEKIKGGLRIQIMDNEGRPLFSSGGPGLTAQAKSILDQVSPRLLSIPNKISIEGHTDARPFPNQQMTNWELSTARASAVRLYLARKGLAESRLTSVSGYAATQPLDKTDPNDPINRRVSIMIWDEEPTPAPPKPGTLPPLPRTPATPAPNGNNNGSSDPARVNNGNGATRPSLPRTNPPRPRAGETSPGTPSMSREELERRLIESTMEKAATPDLSTVGPAASPKTE